MLQSEIRLTNPTLPILGSVKTTQFTMKNHRHVVHSGLNMRLVDGRKHSLESRGTVSQTVCIDSVNSPPL